MAIYDIFIKNPDFFKIDDDKCIYASPPKGCLTARCDDCVFCFTPCFIEPTHSDYDKIIDYFKLHHPEKLI